MIFLLHAVVLVVVLDFPRDFEGDTFTRRSALLRWPSTRRVAHFFNRKNLLPVIVETEGLFVIGAGRHEAPTTSVSSRL